jgi:hypothetical protein
MHSGGSIGYWTWKMPGSVKGSMRLSETSGVDPPQAQTPRAGQVVLDAYPQLPPDVRRPLKGEV